MAATFFILKGLEPPVLKQQPDQIRLMFWRWVVDLGLKRKDWELARGLNAQGKPLPGVKPATAKHRVSLMTPSGKGDPRASYLMPGRGLSRTRSLLVGKAHADYAEFAWRYDPHTGDQWGKILAYHAARGKAYDVVGLSPAGRAWVAAEAARRWRQWLAGKQVDPITPRQSQPAAQVVPPSPTIPLVGRTNLGYAVGGIGGSLDDVKRAIEEGRSPGFMTADEWVKHFRRRAAAIPAQSGQSISVSRGDSNVLLQHAWSNPMASGSQRIDVAVNNLVAGLNAGLNVAQLESLLGGMFERALAEAVRRGVVSISSAGGRVVLKVVR